VKTLLAEVPSISAVLGSAERKPQIGVRRSDTCDRWSALASATQCGHYTQCGGAIYDLICDGGTCHCYVNGETSGPFPAGDACESAAKGAAANVRLCGAP